MVHIVVDEAQQAEAVQTLKSILQVRQGAANTAAVAEVNMVLAKLFRLCGDVDLAIKHAELALDGETCRVT